MRPARTTSTRRKITVACNGVRLDRLEADRRRHQDAADGCGSTRRPVRVRHRLKARGRPTSIGCFALYETGRIDGLYPLANVSQFEVDLTRAAQRVACSPEAGAVPR